MRPPALIDFNNPNKKTLTTRKSTSLETSQPSVNVEMNLDQKNFQMKHDVRPQNNIGIYTNPDMMVMPCDTINERNGLRNMGKGIGFDSTSYNIKPKSWFNNLTFTAERFGTTADFSQKPSFISSWVR